MLNEILLNLLNKIFLQKAGCRRALKYKRRYRCFFKIKKIHNTYVYENISGFFLLKKKNLLKILVLLLKHYLPFNPSNRNRSGISSFLTSKKIKKDLKIRFFKKKVYNNHKFLGKTNSVFRLNMFKPAIGFSVLIKIFKTSYSNAFFGFFEHHDGLISIKKLNQGADVYEPNHEDFYLNFKILDICSKSYLQKIYIFFFGVNSKFFLFRCNISKKVFASAAGSFCVIKNKEISKNIFFVKLPSKICFFFHILSTAFVGRVSNIYYRYTRFSSFSSKFLIKKVRQSTRGIAKNPVDHPNGGRSKIKQPFMNPWGKIAKKNK